MIPEDTKKFLKSLGIRQPGLKGLDDVAEIIYNHPDQTLAQDIYESLPDKERRSVDRYLSHWRGMEELHKRAEALKWGNNHRDPSVYYELSEGSLRSIGSVEKRSRDIN